MKKIIITILSILAGLILCAQNEKVDTIIKNKAYESHYSFKYKEPIYVKYKLYHGGGKCNRSQFHFKVDSVKNTSGPKDYIASGFDEGHLANAEDFAYDCSLMGLTFKFYNCLPQTPNLNRGIWKSYETKIRKLSQTDSLLVICGGLFDYAYVIPNTTVYVAPRCWKIVKSLSTGQIIYALIFTNEAEINSVNSMPIEELVKKLGYDPLK